ncbi:MAG: hypothetical protein ABI151_13565 [Chitinophagaceae bacterium]
MKNLNCLFLTSALILLALTSCTKQLDVIPPTPVTNSTAAPTIAETTTADSFDWSTTKKINFTFEGQTSEAYTLVLQVLDADGNILFQKLQKSTDTYKTTVRIATTQSTINIKYGADVKTIDCSSGIATVKLD